jgi:hypothetical protein
MFVLRVGTKAAKRREKLSGDTQRPSVVPRWQ